MGTSSSGDRVTNAQLRDAIADTKEILRTEQKSEHFKTRVLVVLSAAFTGGAKLIATFGYINIPHL